MLKPRREGCRDVVGAARDQRGASHQARQLRRAFTHLAHDVMGRDDPTKLANLTPGGLQDGLRPALVADVPQAGLDRPVALRVGLGA